MQGMRFTRSFKLALVAAVAAAPVAAHAQGAKGWVGVVITTGIGTMNAAGAMVFTEYPTIESIDPGSPAEKAGLQAGDVLVSINSQDFRKNPVPMGSLLVPGQKIIFRYRRGDSARTVALNVVERPSDSKQYVQLSIVEPVQAAADRAREGRREAELLNRSVVIRSRDPVISVTPLVGGGAGTPTLRLVGAELTELNEDLRKALKLKGDGVFVINVALGTPAGVAGLKSGDVIFEAGKEPIQNPGELIRLMRTTVENSLMIRVMRQQKPQTLTLRW
jgi:serine protease Do